MKRVLKSRKILFFCFFGIMGFFWHWNNNRLVSLRMSSSSDIGYVLTLPNKDKKRLNFFFRRLMLRDGAIYTLIGDKPMSLGGYSRPFASFNLLNLYHACLPYNLKMYWSWQTYLKYQHLFDNSKFILWAEQSPWSEDSDIILFMNKAKATSLVKRYKQDFCQILKKEDISIEELLQEAKSKPLFLEILQKHEGLIGTLLGYGKGNAWLFLRRDLGENIVLSSPWDTKAQSDALNRLYGWLSFFRNKQEDISEEVFGPPFVADLYSEETKQLKEKYLLTRQRIIDIYKEKNFLETTLGLISGANIY